MYLEMTPEQLSQVDHASLYQAREHLPPQFQSMLSPYEHGAFAREATYENPLMALPIAAGTLAYQPYKMIFGARSGADFNQVKEGLKGVRDGLVKKLLDQFEPAAFKDPFPPSI
jgi:hypothetical protein